MSQKCLRSVGSFGGVTIGDVVGFGVKVNTFNLIVLSFFFSCWLVFLFDPCAWAID